MLVLYWVFWLISTVVCSNSTKLIECDSPSQPIDNISSLQSIQHCQIINGDVIIENFQYPLIEFSNLQKIHGDLIIRNSNELIRIEGSVLYELNELKLNKLTSLSLMHFPHLKHVKSLNWRVVPMLSNIKFATMVVNIENIIISDTSLTGFSGFHSKNLQNLDINNNRFLETIDSDVETIQRQLHIVSNAANLKLSLPNLIKVSNVSINDVADLNLENLQEIYSSMHLVNNNFDNLLLPVLQKIGGTLSILKNSKLSTLDLGNLTEINGGLMILNNSNVYDVNFLKKLSMVDGGLEINGNLQSLEFPYLKLIKGSAKIKSSNKTFDCNKIIKSQLNFALRGGKITCESLDSDNQYKTIERLDDIDGNFDTAHRYADHDDYASSVPQRNIGSRLTPWFIHVFRDFL